MGQPRDPAAANDPQQWQVAIHLYPTRRHHQPPRGLHRQSRKQQQPRMGQQRRRRLEPQRQQRTHQPSPRRTHRAHRDRHLQHDDLTELEQHRHRKLLHRLPQWHFHRDTAGRELRRHQSQSRNNLHLHDRRREQRRQLAILRTGTRHHTLRTRRQHNDPHPRPCQQPRDDIRQLQFHRPRRSAFHQRPALVQHRQQQQRQHHHHQRQHHQRLGMEHHDPARNRHQHRHLQRKLCDDSIRCLQRLGRELHQLVDRIDRRHRLWLMVSHAKRRGRILPRRQQHSQQHECRRRQRLRPLGKQRRQQQSDAKFHPIHAIKR